MRRQLLLALVLALAVAGGLARPATAQECPSGTYLTFDHAVYVAVTPPAGVLDAPGFERAGDVGEGTLDSPLAEDSCRRRVNDVTVQRLGTADPAVVLAVEGRAGTIYTIGSRCRMLEQEPDWACLTSPLELDGSRYTAVSVELEPGAAVGPGTLGGEPVDVRELAGVDPGVAVAVEGRDGVAYLASGACPYERGDDLERCLTGPAWLVFDPPGAPAAASIAGYLDRELRQELVGAAVSLVPVERPVDEIPADRSQAIPIGTLTSGRPALTFTAPSAATPGFYEAVVDCAACADAFGGRTAFPLGSLLVGPFRDDVGDDDKGLGVGGIAFLIGGVVFMCLLVAAAIMFRRGYRIRTKRRLDT